MLYDSDAAQLALSREAGVGAFVVVVGIASAACGLSGPHKIVCSNWGRRSGIGIAVVLGLTIATPGMAWASAGCTALNGAAILGTETGSKSGTGFSAGDVITLTVTATGAVGHTRLNSSSGANLIPDTGDLGTSTYVVPADTAETFTFSGFFVDADASFSWSCVSAAGRHSKTDSEKLTTVQTQGSMVVSNTSGAAISGSVNGAIDGALGGISSTAAAPDVFAAHFASEEHSATKRRAEEAFAALGPVNKAPRQVPVFASQWSTWVDVRGSGFEQSDSRVLKGRQINATGGITYKLRPDLVVGAFAGYENFNYDFASLTGNLKGNGGTIGTYAGWQLTPTLRWKGMIGWTGLGYDASAATASGGFDGSRWLFSTGLSGSYRVAAFIVEPSADVFALSERQTGYTDSLGAAHDARSFSTGRVALGGRALAPTQGPFGATPYLGVYSDWRFASDNSLPAAVPFAGISDGWSARVAGGLNMKVFTVGSLSLGGEYGGIGADYKVWTGNARLVMPF